MFYFIRPQQTKIQQPNLVKHLNIDELNHVWAGDVTYIKTNHGFGYMAVVIDLHSREVVGTAVAKRMTSDLVVKAFKNALQKQGLSQKPLIFHSDRGSQYTSKAFQGLLSHLQIRQSFAYSCYENAIVERFFGTLKHECLLLKPISNENHAQQICLQFVRYYNCFRPHSSLGDLTPSAFANQQTKENETLSSRKKVS